MSVEQLRPPSTSVPLSYGQTGLKPKAKVAYEMIIQKMNPRMGVPSSVSDSCRISFRPLALGNFVGNFDTDLDSLE